MQKAFEYIRQHGMITAEDKLIVGVSGGADSVCLLFVLRMYQQEVPFEMRVVHVEHGVRGEESLRDAAFVKALCREWKIPCEVRCVDVPLIAKEKKISVEEAGRKVRYEAFESAGQDWGAYKIAVAHNQNDQAETMVWNMTRGSGLTGAGGIRPVRGNVIRPLLSCSRKEIEQYLLENGIVWHEDRTNRETEYTRNCIRQHILPVMEKELNAKSVEHLARLGEELQRTDQFLDELAQKALERSVILEAQRAVIDLERFQGEEVLIQERILRKCLEQIGCGLRDLGRIHVEEILELCKGQSGRRVSLPGGWQARKSFGHIYLETEDYVKEQAEIVLESRIFSYNQEIIPQKKYTKWLDYDKIKDGLCLRTRQPGDYLIIDQKGGKKKLKTYFIEEKVPVEQRSQIQLVAAGSEILWVIGYRINEAYKVQADTKHVLELRLRGWEE